MIEKRDPSGGERAAVSDYLKRIKDSSDSKLIEEMKKAREYVNGKQHDDGAPGLVRTNLIFASIAGAIPAIYAKNPEIAVTPSKGVTESRREAARKFSVTAELLLQRRFIKDGRLKDRAKSAMRAAMTTGIGWVKMSFQTDIKKDPLGDVRIPDEQDNLERMQYLIADEDNTAQKEARQEELRLQVEATTADVEVSYAEGLVLDRVLSEDIVILDPNIKDFDNWYQASAIAHGIWMTKEDAEARFGMELSANSTEYVTDTNNPNAPKNIRVWEIWDRQKQMVFTVAAGCTHYLRDPWPPVKGGQRFYPFFPLGFNLVDGQFMPLSDVALLKELQDEYNTSRTNFAEHRKSNVPIRFVRKGSIPDSDVDIIVNHNGIGIVAIDAPPNEPLQNNLGNLTNPPIDPNVYDTGAIRADIEWVSGRGDAARGGVLRAKTATEAEILQQGLSVRDGERQDVIEEWITDMAEFALQLFLQNYTPEQVSLVCGDETFWPRMSKEEMFDLVEISIRVGLTGKPNQAQDQKNWIQFMPQIQQLIMQIPSLRQSGQDNVADALIELARETFRRFDDRIDVARLLPAVTDAQGGPSMGGDPAQAEQAMKQAQQAIAQAKEREQQVSQAEMQLQHDQELFALQQKQAMAELKVEYDQLKAAMESSSVEQKLAFEKWKTEIVEGTRIVIAKMASDAEKDKADTHASVKAAELMVSSIQNDMATDEGQ